MSTRCTSAWLRGFDRTRCMALLWVPLVKHARTVTCMHTCMHNNDAHPHPTHTYSYAVCEHGRRVNGTYRGSIVFKGAFVDDKVTSAELSAKANIHGSTTARSRTPILNAWTSDLDINSIIACEPSHCAAHMPPEQMSLFKALNWLRAQYAQSTDAHAEVAYLQNDN